jgi:hypothetical protein
VRTWPEADHGGVLITAEHSRCGTTLKDGAGDIFGLIARGRRLVRGESNAMIPNLGGDLGDLFGSPGDGALLLP